MTGASVYDNDFVAWTEEQTLDEILAESFDYETAVRRIYELLDARH